MNLIAHQNYNPSPLLSQGKDGLFQNTVFEVDMYDLGINIWRVYDTQGCVNTRTLQFPIPNPV